MSAYNMLDIVMKDILQVVTPVQEDWEVRFAIINDLRRVVESVASLRGATVEPYGSFVSNLFTRWGDLDISVELLNGSHIPSTGRKQKQVLLGDLLKALRKKGGWNSLQFIFNARIPILKLKNNRQSISCDISMNNLEAQMKSKILFWINRIDGRFRDMVLLVKEWAKAHKINDSKAGTFNSYSLSLLVIFHFQTCVPAILPPLNVIYPGNMVDDLIGVKVDAENHIAETFDANINRFISDKSRPINRKSVPELFVEFVRKFAQMSSWASELGISPYNGQWEQIKNNMRWLPKTYAVFVEDPFEQPQNTARSVNQGKLEKITNAFLDTYSLLTSKNLNQSSILTSLAPPEVAMIIAKPVIPDYNGGYYHHRTPPQVQRALLPHPHPHPHPRPYPRPYPQLHPQEQPPPPRRSQNGSRATSTTGSTSKGPVQSQQGQQIWRQKTQ
ncbi:PREDICTED: protein HESO1-like isoform X1 [Lupinus angustifolius]|uniref:protein HESO1-like isoform X1 n=1 Tax=Lupinus angustifolius TaxID=3871 RepID=UPI00092ECD32|nr:PREDICTED: protein HESO1-like isoform X1 [Lupinus angustifolius]XP_019439440.1 PREDICTED: protein HESO1-like isoform X1 [Lupinus angustifolius]XP_019439441.1 PREDICTED: protein HESO1-like isoform X1 [Lupinus angustifolius]